MKKYHSVFILSLLLFTALFIYPNSCFSAPFFKDNFDNQPSWNIGQGALPTPSGQQGSWGFWDRQTAANMGCPDINALPSSAGGWLMFTDPTGGVNGSKAIRETQINGCRNGYPGTLQYNFSASHQDIYIGLYMKFEDGYGKSGGFPAGCKIPYRLILDNQEVIYIQYQGSRSGNGFNSSNLMVLTGTSAFNGGNWWNTGIGPSDIYNDHAWHWLEIRVKLNSSGAASDGMIQTWVDGSPRNSVSNVKFYTSGTQTFDRIWLEQGNCSDTAWEQNTWRSVWFDDFTLSASYIGPSGGGGSSGGGDTQAPTVSITSPRSGTVSSTVTVSAAASDNAGIAGVQFKLDGNNLGIQDTTAPFSVSWDTAQYSSGSHTVTAVALDTSGNSTTSTPVTVTIDSSNSPPPMGSGALLFHEPFEDTNFATRGWYDGATGVLDSTQHITGSNKSLKAQFKSGSPSPVGGTPKRILITPSDSVYVSYWVKYSSNWVGSNNESSSGHHEFYLLTNQNGHWDGLAWTKLTAYIDLKDGRPTLRIQDGMNVDTGNVNANLVGVTENRSVAGCNGDSDGNGNGSCYPCGAPDYCNGKYWVADTPYFSDDCPGDYCKSDWHHVEAYIKLNTIKDGIGQADGIMQYWFDGKIVMSDTNAVLRTGRHPDMKFNQFIFAPHVDGSTDQSMWVDELKIWTAPPNSPDTGTYIDAPTRLRIVPRSNP